MSGLSRYYAAAGKMIQSSCINSVMNLLDETCSYVAMSKLETFPTLRSSFTYGLSGTMVEKFLRLIPAFYLFSLLCLSIETELFH